jgi:hypothetical protein
VALHHDVGLGGAPKKTRLPKRRMKSMCSDNPSLGPTGDSRVRAELEADEVLQAGGFAGA